MVVGDAIFDLSLAPEDPTCPCPAFIPSIAGGRSRREVDIMVLGTLGKNWPTYLFSYSQQGLKTHAELENAQ